MTLSNFVEQSVDVLHFQVNEFVRMKSLTIIFHIKIKTKLSCPKIQAVYLVYHLLTR
jgi:hypothetical protein